MPYREYPLPDKEESYQPRDGPVLKITHDGIGGEFFTPTIPLTADLVVAYENGGLYWENELLIWDT